MQGDDDPLDPFLRVLAFTLHESAMQNDLLGGSLVLTRFHTLLPPKIPILGYLRHLKASTQCPKSCFIVALILLDKLLASESHIQVTPNTVHKLILCSLMTASKFIIDRCMTNSMWATIGGLRVEELNILELEFVYQLQFSLVVTDVEYQKYEEAIDRKAKLPEFQSAFV